MQVDFEQLIRKQDFLTAESPPWIKTVWPRIESLTWFIKSNREALKAAGAIYRLGNEWLIVRDPFVATAQSILNRQFAAPADECEEIRHD
jgi:hypothetical protein